MPRQLVLDKSLVCLWIELEGVQKIQDQRVLRMGCVGNGSCVLGVCTNAECLESDAHTLQCYQHACPLHQRRVVFNYNQTIFRCTGALVLSPVPVCECAGMHAHTLHRVLYTATEVVWSMSSPAARTLPDLLRSWSINNDGMI